MDPKVALTVATIAAGASLVGALFAWASARAARLSADGIDRRRHMIESLDAETESFRDALAAVYQAMHDMELGKDSYVSIRLTVRVQLLQTHPLCTPELGAAATKGVAALHRINVKAQKGESQEAGDTEAVWVDFREEARRIFQAQAAERRELIEDVHKARRFELAAIALPFARLIRKNASDDGKGKGAQSPED